MLKIDDLAEKVARILDKNKQDIIENINDYLFDLQCKKGLSVEKKYRKKLTVKIILRDIFTQCKKCNSWDIQYISEGFDYQVDSCHYAKCRECGQEICL